MKILVSIFNINLKVLFLVTISVFLFSCGGKKKPLEVIEEPAQRLIKDLGDKDYSIVLNDMDISEDSKNIIYKHKYIILEPTDVSVKVDSTGWETVSEAFFMKHENDLGLELVSRHLGEFSTVPKPVGFDWAVGNDKYGEWVVDTSATIAKNGTVNTSPQNQERSWRYNSGSRFFLMYWMFSRPTRYGVYNNYANTARGRTAFYGSGKNSYGTNSSYNRTNRSSFYSRKKTNTAWNKTYSTRKSSKSSRYNGGSSSRGRSGGFGK